MSPSLASLAHATRAGLSAARTSEEQRRARADERAISLLVAALLERGDDAVTVGAAPGPLLSQIVSVAPDGRHLAVDAHPERALELSAALPASVIVEHYALADTSGEGELELMPRAAADQRPARAVTHGASPRRMRAPTTSLDALVDHHSLIPRLIRIDVDGMERTVLESARRTIRHYQPVLLVEHGTSQAHGGLGESATSFFEAVRSHHLRIYDLDGSGPYDRDGFARAVSGRRIVNYLLRH